MSDKKATYEKFDRQLSTLLCLSREEWARASSLFAEYFINKAQGSLPQDILRKKIMDAVGQSGN